MVRKILVWLLMGNLVFMGVPVSAWSYDYTQSTSDPSVIPYSGSSPPTTSGAQDPWLQQQQALVTTQATLSTPIDQQPVISPTTIDTSTTPTIIDTPTTPPPVIQTGDTTTATNTATPATTAITASAPAISLDSVALPMVFKTTAVAPPQARVLTPTPLGTPTLASRVPSDTVRVPQTLEIRPSNSNSLPTVTNPAGEVLGFPQNISPTPVPRPYYDPARARAMDAAVQALQLQPSGQPKASTTPDGWTSDLPTGVVRSSPPSRVEELLAPRNVGGIAEIQSAGDGERTTGRAVSLEELLLRSEVSRSVTPLQPPGLPQPPSILPPRLPPLKIKPNRRLAS